MKPDYFFHGVLSPYGRVSGLFILEDSDMRRKTKIARHTKKGRAVWSAVERSAQPVRGGTASDSAAVDFDSSAIAFGSPAGAFDPSAMAFGSSAVAFDSSAGAFIPPLRLLEPPPQLLWHSPWLLDHPPGYKDIRHGF
jgi:hypothetical protein